MLSDLHDVVKVLYLALHGAIEMGCDMCYKCVTLIFQAIACHSPLVRVFVCGTLASLGGRCSFGSR